MPGCPRAPAGVLRPATVRVSEVGRSLWRVWPGADRRRTAGVLVLAGTPIGDVADASPRLLRELGGADVIAAEDTRRLRGLLDRLGLDTPARVVSYFEGNESARTPELVAELIGRSPRRAGHRRRHALGVRPRLPAGGRRGRAPASGSPRCPGRPRCSPRWPSPACRSTASASRGSCRARPGNGAGGWPQLAAEAAHDGVLRGAAPDGGDPGGDGRRLRCRTFGRGLPRADQDLRGGRAGGRWPSSSTGPPTAVRGEVTLVVGRVAARSADLADGVVEVAALVAAGVKLKPAVSRGGRPLRPGEERAVRGRVAAMSRADARPPTRVSRGTSGPARGSEGELRRCRTTAESVAKVDLAPEPPEAAAGRRWSTPTATSTSTEESPGWLRRTRSARAAAGGRDPGRADRLRRRQVRAGPSRPRTAGRGVVAGVALHPNDAAPAGSRRWTPALAADRAPGRSSRASGRSGRPGWTSSAPGRGGAGGQRDAFAAHIALAKAYDKTLVIHDRDAHAAGPRRAGRRGAARTGS